MERTVLRCTTGGHYKEYEVVQSGVRVDLYWGKIGNAKQSDTKMFLQESAARDFARAKVHAKRDKGYTVFTHTLEPAPAPGVFSDDIRLMRDIENGLLV